MTWIYLAATTVGVVGIIPLVLWLTDPQDDLRAGPWVRLWPWVALPAVIAGVLHRGSLSAGMSMVYLGAAVVLTIAGVLRLFGRKSFNPGGLALVAALVFPMPGALALTAERFGFSLAGASPSMLVVVTAVAPTAGVGAAMIASLVCHSTGTAASRLAALAVLGGAFITGVGHFSGPIVGVLGVATFSFGWALASVLVLRHIWPVARAKARNLLGVGACGGVLAAVLLTVWAVLASQRVVDVAGVLPALALTATAFAPLTLLGGFLAHQRAAALAPAMGCSGGCCSHGEATVS